MRRSVPLVLVLVLVLVGCDGGGVVRTDDGRWLGMTAETFSAETRRSIVRDVDRELGEHWRCAVALAPAPYRDTDDWRWRRLDARIELVGDGEASLPVPADEVRVGVARYLRPKVDDPARNLSLTVIEATDAVRHRALVAERTAKPAADTPTVAPAIAPVAVPHDAGVAAATYLVQPGDTLAAISTAFYGTPQHWRRIADANPAVDPARMTPGTALVIPPAR